MIRYLSAMTTSAGITLALLYVMQLLIDLSLEPPKSQSPRTPPLVWVPQPPKETPPPVDDEQKRLKKLTTFSGPPTTTVTPVEYPDFELPAGPGNEPLAPDPHDGEFAPATIDGPLVAMLKVEPPYPVRAAEQGLEGYVVVEFDVAANGTVNNVRVIASSHRLFESAAIKAAQRFRYKARVVDGTPLPSFGIRNRFTFELERG